MPAELSVVAGVPSRRGVTATDMVTGEATAQMYPAPTDGETIAAGRLEVAGQWGHWIRVEVSATSHKARSLLFGSPRQSSLRLKAVRHLDGLIAFAGSRPS
jgi:hypothetical protein